MSWIIPENKLDAQQRDFLDNIDVNNRNIWIKGFAGSGKSVLLVYSVKKVLSRSPSSRILLIVFTRSLAEMFKAAFREIGLNVSVDTYYAFMKSGMHYDYILCDEVQDLPPRVLREMNARSEHIVVAGDENQSIYESDPQWHELTVSPSEVKGLLNANEFILNIIHRLSRSIIDAVQRFLPRMNIFSSKRDMTKSDTQIRLCEASSEMQEVHYVVEQAMKAVNTGYTTAILLPSQKRVIEFVNEALKDAGKPAWEEVSNKWGKPDFKTMNSYMSANGLKIQYVGNGYGCFSENDRRIVIMTFHSAKGLDFDNVFIPFANSSMYISPDEGRAKTLFMVAMTRSRANLYISYYGYPSDYLENFQSNCSHIDISSSSSGPTNTNSSSGGNVWGF